MAKAKTAYVCRECGAQAPKWSGQCADCGDWNTLEEASGPVAPGAGGRRIGYAGAASSIRLLSEIAADRTRRTPTGMDEFDRVLGGGIVPGSVVLLGGEPGIGKSTLLLQLLAEVHGRLPGLYAAGEESLEQISLRAARLGLPQLPLPMLAETAVEEILAHCHSGRPALLVVDSIQTMYTAALQSAPGAVAQVREVAAQLVRYAKQTGTAVVLVGHVTKEGALAGPRVLEHMVDTVLYFESDVGGRYRIVRAAKNRFGAVNELGIFAMTDQGLKPVSHPSAIFLSRRAEAVAGSVITCVREGSRPLLLEVQALVDDSSLGNPRRLTVGLDTIRLAMLLAVLHRHGSAMLQGHDVFLNVVGGMRIGETGADLAAVLSVWSSFRDHPLPMQTVVFGELGLSGEVRPVAAGEERLQEAAKHGFSRAIVPAANVPRRAPAGLEVVGVRRLQDALDVLGSA
ncbi:MAG TPA: DNA repair protein RadA [Gammaproteobacteria bacterium]|nr:DNA repair protein RadA [Gammaproteobacteria bacterium]